MIKAALFTAILGVTSFGGAAHVFAEAEKEGFFQMVMPKQAITEQATPADPDNSNQVRLGNILYAENCASCHGAALEGDPEWETADENGDYRPPPHDDSGHTWHHSDKELFEYVKFGGEEIFKDYPDITSNMPGFEGILSNDEIWAILAFIKGSWSKENLAWQGMVSAPMPVPAEYLSNKSSAENSESK